MKEIRAIRQIRPMNTITMPSTTTNQVGISAPGTAACTTGAAVASVLVNASSMIYLTVCYALGPASTTS